MVVPLKAITSWLRSAQTCSCYDKMSVLVVQWHIIMWPRSVFLSFLHRYENVSFLVQEIAFIWNHDCLTFVTVSHFWQLCHCSRMEEIMFLYRPICLDDLSTCRLNVLWQGDEHPIWGPFRVCRLYHYMFVS